MIAVLGATGRIGGEVMRLLEARGAQARALRRPEVDLRDEPSVRRALDGATRLFLVTPHGPEQDLLEAAAVRAAADAGIGHVVKVSGGAASLGPNGASATATAHWRTEQLLEASGMGFSFLRPSMFQQGVLGLPRVGPVLVAPLGRAPIAMIDLRDVAAVAASVLLDPTPATGAWQLTGPRGVTLAEIAAAVGARYLPIPDRLAARGLARRGASPFEIEHVVRMAAYFASGADGTPTDHVERLTGRAPRPVEALLTETS